MEYYPIFLRVADRPCLVIGGGAVAQQKVESLLAAGADVTVVSPRLTTSLAALAAGGKVRHEPRPYVSSDLHGVRLAFAATNDEALQARIARDADAAGVLLNVVDRPPLCAFITPSVMARGDLIIATSTSGASPALAKRIRGELEARFGPEYALALRLLRRLRERLTGAAVTPAERQRVFAALVNSRLLEYLRERRTTDIDALLANTVGNGVSLASLGMELTE